MSLRNLRRKAAAALICLIFGVLCAVPMGAVSADGDSFPVLDFEPAYSFPLTADSVFAEEGSLLSSADGVYTVAASGSGSEEVSLRITAESGFDSSLLGKEYATLHLNIRIDDLNGFLDSSGNFRGGTVRLILPGIEYKWNLDGVDMARGDNRLHLNIRTAEKIYPEDGIPEEDGLTAFADEDEEQAAADVSCSLIISLKKLPSVEKAAFSVTSSAIELVKVPTDDAEPQAEEPKEEINGALMIVAVCLGVAIVVGICIAVTVVTEKEMEKKRNLRRKKRARAKSSERNGENEL